MNNIRDEEGIITDTEEIQRIMRTYYKNLQSTRMENLKYIHNFLSTYHLPKLKSRSNKKFKQTYNPCYSES